MKKENMINAVMEVVNRLGLASNPDVPMFKKNMERLTTEMYELIDEGEFRKAYTVVSKLETTVITFVNSLWYHNHISFTAATELKERFHVFVTVKRSELWNKACKKDKEEFDRRINEKLQKVYRECDEMRKSMNHQSSKPSKENSTIIIIMK